MQSRAEEVSQSVVAGSPLGIRLFTASMPCGPMYNAWEYLQEGFESHGTCIELGSSSAGVGSAQAVARPRPQLLRRRLRQGLLRNLARRRLQRL